MDDCAFRHNWVGVLQRAFGASPELVAATRGAEPVLVGKADNGVLPVNLFALESPEPWLIGRLEDSSDQTFRWGTGIDPNTAHDSVDVLFLDLRLHQSTALGTEARWFEQLLAIAREYSDDQIALAGDAGNRTVALGENVPSTEAVSRPQPATTWRTLIEPHLERLQDWSGRY